MKWVSTPGWLNLKPVCLGQGDPNSFSIKDYANITFDLFANQNYDALSKSLHMRERELAAIAPDLFDITYYSIEPNFHENYLKEKLDLWLGGIQITNPPMTYMGKIWRDIGYTEDSTHLPPHKDYKKI